MLRACRQALKRGGRLAFQTIQPTPGLSRERRRRANLSGPPAVAMPSSYESLLRTAGFIDVVSTDQTTEFRFTLQRWMDATDRHATAIRDATGDDAFDERYATRRQRVDAIDDGLLARFQYTAVRP